MPHLDADFEEHLALVRGILRVRRVERLERRHDARVAAEALRLAEQSLESISALVTDVRMVPMNGRELAHRLRAQRPRLPVVFLSGFTDSALDDLVDGDHRFVPKPFSSAALIDLLTVGDVIVPDFAEAVLTSDPASISACVTA